MSGRTGRAGRGFTLIEVLVSTATMIVALGVVFSIYIGQQHNFIVGNSYLDIHQGARIAMDSIAKDLHWAKELVPSMGGYTTSGACIVLKVPSIDSSHDVIDIDSKFDYFVYRLNGTSLERIVTNVDAASSRSSGARTVAKNVASIAFTFKDKSNQPTGTLSGVTAIDVALTAQKNVRAIASINVSERLATTVALRNTGK